MGDPQIDAIRAWCEEVGDAKQAAWTKGKFTILLDKIERLEKAFEKQQEEAFEHLAEIDRLQEELSKEKGRRVYYQDIVYSVCNLLGPFTESKRIVCGTAGQPSTEVQDAVTRLKAALDTDCRIKEYRDLIKAMKLKLRTHGDCLDDCASNADPDWSCDCGYQEALDAPEGE